MNPLLDMRHVLLSVAVMALTTYLIRAIPMVLCRKKLKNWFLQSFLYYIPYAVLAAMTVPAIFSATSSPISAAVGFVAALIVSCLGKSLMPVALASCAAVFVVEWLMRLS